MTSSGVTPTFVQEVISQVGEYNIMRDLAKVYTIKGNGTVPILSALAGAWGAEGATLTPGAPTLANKTFGAWDYDGVFAVSDDSLDDGFWNIERDFKETIAETIGEAEVTAMLGTGAGTDRPQGIFNKTADTTTAGSGALTQAEIVTFLDSLDTKYLKAGRAVAIMSPSTLSYIANLETATGVLKVDRVNKTINGVKYHVTSLAPAFAANTNVVAYGDFKRGYGIAQRDGGDKQQVKVKVVDATDSFNKNVFFKTRVDGKILDSSAFKVLKIKA